MKNRGHRKSATQLVRETISQAFTDPENQFHFHVSEMVIGVSGGVDSVVLAHALIAQPPSMIRKIAIAHFDHALRPDSARDETFVRTLAEQWGVAYFSKRWQNPQKDANVEEVARNARYGFLLDAVWELTGGGRGGMLALGHHLDDLAETVLLNVIRGSGIDGLSSMRPFSKAPFDSTISVARPLLRLRHSTLQEYALENRLQWRDDPTNKDLRYTRNYIRHIVMPALRTINPSVEEALSRLSRAAWNDRQRLARFTPYLDAYTAEVEFEKRVLMPFSAYPVDPWHSQEWIGRMRNALRAAFGYRRTVGIERLEEVFRRISTRKEVTGPHPLGNGIAWSVLLYAPVKGELTLALSFHDEEAPAWEPWGPWIPAELHKQFPIPLAVPGTTTLPNDWKLTVKVVPASKFNPKRSDPQTGWLDLDKAKSLAVVPAKTGMRMAPLGMEGNTRALGDIFTDRKVQPVLRSQWPVVIDAMNSEVLWLTWLVTSEHAKITPESTQALHLRWKGPERPEHRLIGELL